MVQDFRKLEVWGKAHAVTLRVYDETAAFPREEQFGLTSQMRRAASSIPTNIAEGCMRRTDTDFARFLYNAIGSASELDYLLLLSRDLNYLNEESFGELLEEAQRIKRMLASFIQRLQASGQQPTAESQQP